LTRIYILTAEKDNYVPVELHKAAEAAEAAELSSEIIDVNDCVLSEGFIDSGNQKQSVSRVFVIDKTGMRELKVDADTFVISLSTLEHHSEIKMSIVQRLIDNGAKILNQPASMTLCNDKMMSQVKLNTAGIRTPFSFTVTHSDDLKKVVDAMEDGKYISFPVIIKTLLGTHGIGVMRADSKPSLISIAQTLIKQKLDFMIQEFIEHEQSCRAVMLGSNLLAANLRGQPKGNGEFRTNSHLGSETEPYTLSDVELETAKQIVSIFGATFCAIDYIIKKRSDGTSELIVLEVNGSPGLEGIQKDWPEKNLAAEVIKFVMEQVTKTDPVIVPPSIEIATPVEPTISTEPPVLKLPAPEIYTTPIGTQQIAVRKAGEGSGGETTEPMLQSIEQVVIHRVIDEPIDARIDTGAKVSSIHVDKFELINDEKNVKFTRGETSYTMPVARMVRIRNVHGGENTRRPVIKLDATIGEIRVDDVEFNLNNREKMKYEVLIGRNILKMIGVPVSIAPEDTPVDTPQTKDEPEEVIDTNGEEE